MRQLTFVCTLAVLSCGSPVSVRGADSPPPTGPAVPTEAGVSVEASKPPTSSPGEPAESPAKQLVGEPSTSESTGLSQASRSEGACPADMLMVEGSYCPETDADDRCRQSWFDESNKKKVCEVFEPPISCKGERRPLRYCIDRFEWPNREGERPEVMNRFHQAQVKCAAVGKRLCTESEWTLACEGPSMKPFPYGFVRDPRKCNGDRKWDNPDMNKVALRDADELGRLWQGVRSGSQPWCVSDYGVSDMTGNADEVVGSETTAAGWRGRYDSVHTGGPWYGGVRNQCRPKIYTHDEGFYYYFLSFRCCAEPDGLVTDPRTPKQRSDSWQFSRVERLADFTREEVRTALERKRKDGHCGCAELKSRGKRAHCNTLCGTLLPSQVTDAPQEAVQGDPPFGAQRKADRAVLERARKASLQSPPARAPSPSGHDSPVGPRPTAAESTAPEAGVKATPPTH
jgi:sulfatase modifying factor 1